MTIIVVGHGLSPRGRNWGKQIDKYPVVRMWDWQWQTPLDHGERYDWGVLTHTPKGMAMWARYNHAWPAKGWLAYWGKPIREPLPPNTHIMDNLKWEARVAEMGACGTTGKLTLTRGCAAAAWALMNYKKVILVGFDNVCLGTNQDVEQAFSPEYWADYMSRFKPGATKIYGGGSPKTATHDMAYELPFLRLIAKEHNAELLTAQEAWP